MDKSDRKHLDFVLRYYQAGKFDTRQAIRRVMAAKRQPVTAHEIPLWHKWAVVASLTLLLIGGAWAAYTLIEPGNAREESQSPRHEQRLPTTPSARHFHFDNTPLSEVLKELGKYYGVTLRTETTDKRLTADFDSDSLDDAVAMIEQVLNVQITKEQKP